MPRRIGIMLLFAIAGWPSLMQASLLTVNSIAYSVDLTTSSGNSIRVSGEFTPGTDVYCLPGPFSGPCAPQFLHDTSPGENSNAEADLFVLFNAEAESVSMLVGDGVVGAPELFTGTLELTFADLGWGSAEGAIQGVEACGIVFVGCGPEFGFQTEFSDRRVTIELDSVLFLFATSAGALSGISMVTAHLELAQVPVPETSSLLVLAITILGFCSRKRA